MKKLIILALALGCLGCKGPAGKNGRDGASPIIKESKIITGSVISNDFTIYSYDIGDASQVSVYLSNGSQATELPYYLPAQGVNAFYIATTGSIRFVNCQLAGGTSYIISLTFI